MKKILTTLSRSNKTVLQEWQCCGNIWQLILSPKTAWFRQDWSPKCPTCGAKGQPFNPEKWEEVQDEDKMGVLTALLSSDR